MAGKRVGFVDYILDNFHSNTYLRICREELKDRGFEVTGCIATEETAGREWAEKNRVPYFDNMEALDANVDCYAIMAPSNPETHLGLCQQTFPFGKTTYVDKTFAPDLPTAKAIFELADEHGTAIQTSSALRYTNVQEYVQEVGRDTVRHMVAWGGGRSFGEYGIHPTELVISCMGSEAEQLMVRLDGDMYQLIVNFSGGRTAVINSYCNTSTSFAASVTTDKETKHLDTGSCSIFVNMAAGFLDLFETGTPNIDRAESLMIRAILDAAADPAAQNGFVGLNV